MIEPRTNVLPISPPPEAPPKIWKQNEIMIWKHDKVYALRVLGQKEPLFYPFETKLDAIEYAKNTLKADSKLILFL